MVSSCGCTGVFTQEGEPIAVPMVLSPSKSFPILVSIDTRNRNGKESVSVMVLYEYREKPLFSAGNILFEVVPQCDMDVSE
jgi:hypothetical protein